MIQPKPIFFGVTMEILIPLWIWANNVVFFLHKPINWVFNTICLPGVLCLICSWWTQKVTLIYRQNKLFPHKENLKLLMS